MKDIRRRAEEYRRSIEREARAHALSAEYHRRHDMWLGVVVTLVGTLVTTGIFASLVSQLKLDGKQPLPWQLPTGGLLYVFLAVALLSIAAPILTNVHTRLHDAADAISHGSTASLLEGVLSDIDVLLLRYADDARDRKSALDELQRILTTYSHIRAAAISMPAKAYVDADRDLLLAGNSEQRRQLIVLNERIAEMEQQGGPEAVAFFQDHLADGLVFRRANGSLVGKNGPDGFLASLSKAPPFQSRSTSEVEVRLMDDRALVTLIVTVTRTDGSEAQYRNIREFADVDGRWLLELWYNYELAPASA